MSTHHDPDLEDVLQDDELRRVASLLSAARTPEPPLDDAYRTGLRRQLMQEAWAMAEGRRSWWRRAFAPPGIAWAGAVAGVLLIAAVALYTSQQGGGTPYQVVVESALDNKSNVALAQPILVSFNQPMDHQSTEAAVQITPATTVSFQWDQSSRTLSVQPASGNLAPNTQYQVTIGPGARTATAQPLATAQTIRFVTQAPSPTPTPSPTPRPTPVNPLNEKQVAGLNGSTALVAQWSADSSSIYFIAGNGMLVVTTKSGAATQIAPDGVSSLAISPAGDRLVYIRNGKIEVLDFGSGKTAEIASTAAPVRVGWAADRVIWATAGGIFEESGSVETRLAALPASGAVSVVSIAPDGTHAIYTQDTNLFVLDIGTGKGTQLGQAGSTFAGWSPDGTLLLYATPEHISVSDTQGNTLSTLPSGEAGWSGQDAILLGSDTNLFQVRPDGSNLTRLASGTYHQPLWAPDATTFAFVRGDLLWVGTAPALPPQATAVDEAGTVVKQFMDFRLAGKSDEAAALLDAKGKGAYSGGGLNLVITGDPTFSRYYVLTQELVATSPDTVRVVVRLVLSHGKVDVSDYEETLTLVRDPTSRQLLVDQATASSQRDLGRGAEVVSVEVSRNMIQVTFDSDLDPVTVMGGGVVLLDSSGKQIDATIDYANRVATLAGFNLKEGAQYKLVVQTTIRDVQGHNVAAEYDLDVFGPSMKKHGGHLEPAPPSPSPSPAAS